MNSGDRNMCITAAIVMLVVLFCFSRKEGMTESPTSISLGQGTLKLTLGGAPTKPKAPKAPSKSDQAKAAAGVLMVDEKGNPVSTVNSQGQFVRSSLPGSTPGAAGTIGTGLMNQGGGAVTVGTGKPISVSNRVSAPGATPTAGAQAAGGVAGGVQSHTHGPDGSFVPSMINGKVVKPQSLSQQMALQEPNTANALAQAPMIAQAPVIPKGLNEVQKAAFLAAREKAAADKAQAQAAAGPRQQGSEAITETVVEVAPNVYKVITNRRVDGSNMKNGRYDKTTIAACKENCDKDEDCHGFVFDRPQSWCQLKSSKTPKKYIRSRDFYSKVVPGAAPDEEDEQPAEASNNGPFAITSKHNSHKNGTSLAQFWVQPEDCANRKPGEKFLVTDSQGYQQVFGAAAINANDAGLCYVQPDRRPPTVKLSTNPMLRWVVGDEAFLTNPNALVAGTCTQAKLNQICVNNNESFGPNKEAYKFLKFDTSAKSGPRSIGIPGVARCVRTPDFEFPGNKDFRTRQTVYNDIQNKCVVKGA
tara:strand:+ start:1038 stop:2627 length:1590 start_codon:yes stop_codon:yes gene_type:complete